jgi:polyketide cyclase/dehydrase/lipid transport protein
MRAEASQVIERPVAAVFRFCAQEQVRNHPRWDPDIELEQTSDGPIRVGTVIRRRNSRSGKPVEGTMEVVEFEPERAVTTVIREGPVEVRGRMTFEALTTDRTKVTISAEMAGADERWDPGPIAKAMERSVHNIKQLIEAEV